MTVLGPDAKPQLNSTVTSDAEASLELGASDVLPRSFGRLTLLRRLARGGMGEVYLAATRGIEGAERPCVVKTIRQEHAGDKSFRARFLDETRIQAQLQHPGIVQILEAATMEDERPYAVVEYVEGRHLGEIQLRSNQLGVRIDWADAVAIGICFGDALAHVHERTDATGRPLDIAHRDLSPQNVMVGYAGDLKLIDFGTARGENRRCRTVSGIVFAKPGYVAPEVANQIPGSAPADLYAFGVMLWELLAGRRFLQGDSVEHQAQVAKGELRLPALASSIGAPERLDTILEQLTDPELSKRTASARRAVQDLAELLKQAPSLADGDRSVRGRIALLMQKLYPAEPARSRADFARRVSHARQSLSQEASLSARPGMPEPSPAPAVAQDEIDGLLAGTRYRLAHRISEGSMGEVWEAEHVDLGRTVALKLLPSSVRSSGVARQRFRAEARVIARLDHPGLVKIHDFGVTADGRCYYGMELLEGETLEARLAKGPLTWRVAVKLVREAASALGAAHQAGILHRDITPSNLFLTTSGQVKLLDFGVARPLTEKKEETQAEAPLVVGTPEYISPEQAAGAPSDGRSDLYALGVVLYELLTGRLPHPLGEEGSATLPALLTAKITLVPPCPSSLVPDLHIPPALDRIVARMLERDAERRYASAESLIDALEDVIAPSRTLNLKRSSSRSLLLSAAATFALVLGVGIVWKSWSSAEPVATQTLDLDALALEMPEEESANVDDPSDAAREPGAPGVEARAAQRAENGDLLDVERSTPSARSAPPASEHPEVRVALDLLKRGQKIAAHHKMKALAAAEPADARVFSALVQTAKGVKAWGEALDAARRKLELDPNPEAFLQVARLEKMTLRGNPVTTLESLLRAYPDNSEGASLLAEYTGRELARR